MFCFSCSYVFLFPSSLFLSPLPTVTHTSVIRSKTSLPTLTSSSAIDLFYPLYHINLEVPFFPSETPYLLVTHFQHALPSLGQSCFGFHLHSVCPQHFTRDVLPLCNYWPHSEPRACEEPGESTSLPFY